MQFRHGKSFCIVVSVAKGLWDRDAFRAFSPGYLRTSVPGSPASEPSARGARAYTSTSRMPLTRAKRCSGRSTSRPPPIRLRCRRRAPGHGANADARRAGVHGHDLAAAHQESAAGWRRASAPCPPPAHGWSLCRPRRQRRGSRRRRPRPPPRAPIRRRFGGSRRRGPAPGRSRPRWPAAKPGRPARICHGPFGVATRIDESLGAGPGRTAAGDGHACGRRRPPAGLGVVQLGFHDPRLIGRRHAPSGIAPRPRRAAG